MVQQTQLVFSREPVDQRARERRAVIDWARRALKQQNVVFFDTETTGFGPTAEVVDLAVVGKLGVVTFETLVRPVRPIPVDASRIHGIYDDDVMDAPRWAEVLPRLRNVLAGNTVVVYNAGYDRDIVKNGCWLLNEPIIDCQWECAMLQFAQFKGEPSTREVGQYKWHKLGDALTNFGMTSGSHRARSDAEACRRLVLALAATNF